MAVYDENNNLHNDMDGEETDEVTNALDFLESRGFFIHNLWHIQDVQIKFDCSSEDAFEVLDRAVNGEYIIQQINDRISEFGGDLNLKEK